VGVGGRWGIPAAPLLYININNKTMKHHIITTNAYLTASLITREDGYSTRYWTIQLSETTHLSRPLKHALAKAFGIAASLATFDGLTDEGVLTMHEDLMN
jgi:hypothetical protein